MSVGHWITGSIAVLLIVALFGALALGAAGIVRTVRLGAPDGSRGGPLASRLTTMLTEILGHTRMLKWGFIGVAHWFVMVGFGALVLTLAEAVGECFNPEFEIPWLGHQAWYGLFVELIAFTTFAGIVTLIVVRQRNHPRRPGRRSRFSGSNFAQAYFVEGVILTIAICIFAIRGFKAANGWLPYPTWAAPISTGLGQILPAWPAAITVFALIKVAVSSGWAVVISRQLTMGVAWHRFTAFFNIYFKRSGKAAVPALGALRPMISRGEVLDFEKADPEVDTFGAGKVEDFTWKGWLDFTTCTECGRCQSQCPAWNTAKPLSPKLLILALRDHAYAKAPYLAAGGRMDMAGTEQATPEQLAHLDPLAMLEAQRPLVGGASDDPGMLGGVIDPEVLWDCTTCGACVNQCPVDIEHVDHIVDMRRYQVMIESEFPSELGGLFRNLENKGNPWGQNQSARLDWAKDLDFDVPVVKPGEELDADYEYLFWVGCAGAFEDRAKKTTQAVAELLYMAAVGFAVLGTGETCTGDPARRAGNEFLFQMLAQQNVETINAAMGDRKPAARKVVVTCAHCFNTLRNEYPQLGGDFQVVHHTQLLNRLVREKRLIPVRTPNRTAQITDDPAGPSVSEPAAVGVGAKATEDAVQAPGADPSPRTAAEVVLAAAEPGSVTYHDPCYLGRHNQVYTPPRELIGATGSVLTEMPRNANRSFCCGAGGARMWMEERVGKRINLERTDEALGTGAKTIITGCPFCRVMLTDGVTARQNTPETADAAAEVRVDDVANLLLAAVKPSGTRPHW